MQVRKAIETDLEVLADLNAHVQALHVEHYPAYFTAGAAPSSIKEFLQRTLSNPVNIIAVAETSAGAAGYVWAEFQERPATPFTLAVRRIYVHHLAVLPAARRRGAATALICYVENLARSHSITEILLDTWAANADALTFFAAQGFMPIRIVQRKLV